MDMISITLLVYIILSALPHPSAQATFEFDQTVFINDRLSIKKTSGPIAPPFQYHIQSFLPSKRTGTVVALGDLNGDGTLDILTDHKIDNKRHIEAWINNGIGGPDCVQFSPAVDLDIIGPAVFAVGDMNGDGIDDLIVGRKYEMNQVHISRQGDHQQQQNDGENDDNYWVVNLPEIAGTLPSETKSIAVADVDGDGFLDIIERDAQRNRILINDGTGQHYTIVHLPNPVSGNKFVTAYANNIAVADMNGDGNQELLFCDVGEGSNTLMKDMGDGEYGVVDLPGEQASRNLVVGDVNGDGYLDIVTGLEPVLLLNSGNGVDYDIIELPVPPTDSVKEVALEDLNGDGLLDIIYCTMDGPMALIHRGDGSVDVYTIPYFGEYGFISMAFGDIDNDGVIDLAMAHSEENHSHILLLSGQDGPMCSPKTSPTNAQTSAPTASPTDAPTASPTGAPVTSAPTPSPTNVSTTSPTDGPTHSVIDTTSPTDGPTHSVIDATTPSPTGAPTTSPTDGPTSSPTDGPTHSVIEATTPSPTGAPITSPTNVRTTSPIDALTSSLTSAPITFPVDKELDSHNFIDEEDELVGHIDIDDGDEDKLVSGHGIRDIDRGDKKSVSGQGKGDILAFKFLNKSTLSTLTIKDYTVLFLVVLLVLILLCLCCKRCRRRKDDQTHSSGGSILLRTAKARLTNKLGLSEIEESEMVRLQAPMRVI